MKNHYLPIRLINIKKPHNYQIGYLPNMMPENQPQQQNQADPEPTKGEGNGEGEGHGDGDKHPDDCECDACKMAKLQAAYEACQVELESTKAEIDALLKEKEELNEKCLKSDEQVKTLEEKCTSLEDALKEKDVFAAECQHKCEEYEAKLNECSNYAEIKSQLDEANAKLHTYHCKELEMSAIELMKDESINDTYSKQILDKCKEGLYASVEDIQVDIAVGIYKSRANGKNTYSTNINSTNTQTIKWDEMTREERIKARNAK
jgi:predicted nuclease with TOPRIM domain